MAGATTFHKEIEDFDKEKNRENYQANEVPKLFTSALNSLLLQKNKELEQLKQKVEEFGKQFGFQDKEIYGLKKRIAELEKDVQTLTQKFTSSTKELTKIIEKLKDIESKNKTLARKLEDIEGDRNIIYLGEMCRRLQENIYRYVFPEKVKISSKVSYKIKNLDNDIDRNKKLKEEERKEAIKRWQKLRQEVDPEKFVVIEELQKLRNTSAHPEVTDEIKDIVSNAAEELNEQGVFEFIGSLEDVKEVIRIWERTEDYVKKKQAETEH